MWLFWCVFLTFLFFKGLGQVFGAGLGERGEYFLGGFGFGLFVMFLEGFGGGLGEVWGFGFLFEGFGV